MTIVNLSGNRSCFGHGVHPHVIDGYSSGWVFDRLGWSGLVPVFAEVAMIGGLKDQLWEDS